MKRIKKLASLLLAMVMVLAMSVTAFAADAEPLPQAGETEDILAGHTYKAFQIFSGTQNPDETKDASLASIEWGSGVNGDALLAALKTDDTIKSVFTDVTTAAGVAKAINDAKWGEDSAEARAFARVAYANITGDGTTVVNGQTELAAGYYLVVDNTEFDENDTNTVRNLALLQLTQQGTFEIKTKTDVPKVEKKVQETNDTTGVTTGWQDAADYDIGDAVPFQLTATLPTDYDSYVRYTLTFHDTLSEGLSYNSDAKVYVVNGETETELSGATITGSKDSPTLTVAIADLKQVAGVTKDSKIVVRYTANLTDAAVAGSAGNTNEVSLEYSNDPNDNGSGEPPTGETPKDKVVVFTYNIVADKVREDGMTALEGAGFTLYKFEADENDWVSVGDEIKGDKITTFEFKGADAGKYKLVETTVPAGYNKADDIVFIVEATYDTEADEPTVTSLVVKNEAGDVISGEDGSFTATVDTGVLNTTVVNQKGSLLPETGGIGTTIFYVVGGILVVAAGILLVTKKRMSVR